MNKIVLIPFFIGFLLITGCSSNLYEIANQDKTIPKTGTPGETEDPGIVDDTTIQVRAVYLAEIITNNSILPVTPVKAGESNDLIFQIENNGSDPLIITGIEADSDSFECLETLPLTVEPGGEHQFGVRVTPSEPSNYDSLLRIESNDPVTPEFEFTVSTRALNEPVYVSADVAGAGSGTYSDPYRDLSTAISKADEDGTVVINSGVYDGLFTIGKPLNLIGNFRYNGSWWVMVPEDETDGRPVLQNSTTATDNSTVHITESPLSSEMSLISLNINTPNASSTASTVLIDSQTTTSGVINIRNCNISNPDDYSNTHMQYC
ncbi:MAG: hypothetical protein PF637_09460 [Spirochaetes bacterium]|nr:hypothetical protein [Spirochaetota bacterium]